VPFYLWLCRKLKPVYNARVRGAEAPLFHADEAALAPRAFRGLRAWMVQALADHDFGHPDLRGSSIRSWSVIYRA
jgi:hypothetical protein